MLRAFVFDLNRQTVKLRYEQNIAIVKNNDDYLSMLYPLKDSNFGNDISSERSKQMIWGGTKKV